jgi:hypothetical protein
LRPFYAATNQICSSPLSAQLPIARLLYDDDSISRVPVESELYFGIETTREILAKKFFPLEEDRFSIPAFFYSSIFYSSIPAKCVFLNQALPVINFKY